MAKLVELDDLKVYLRVSSTSDDTLLGTIRDAVEDLLEKETNNIFGPEQAGVVELHDGRHGSIVMVNRRIKTLTQVRVTYGLILEDPIVIDLPDMAFQGRKIVSRLWRLPRDRLNIEVTYTAEANQPALAKLAVKEVCAQIYRQMGSEDSRSETIGDYEHVLRRSIDESQTWARAVALCSVGVLG